ncbi:DoxX family protein [Novosphingopyxis sp.]|uniref:DoxX family protein n=1 Tax=Novosphingopyxis sp. TaxID=2709690 RepID=UPI003B5A6D6B
MHFISKFAALIARILISPLFILAGLGKFRDIAGTDTAIQAAGLPAGLAVPTATFEIVVGLLLLLGLFTRLSAILLAGFCVVTALFFHHNFPDQAPEFLKNLAIAGGLIMIFSYGNVSHGLDRMRGKRDRERDLHEAELEEHREREAARKRGDFDVATRPDNRI